MPDALVYISIGSNIDPEIAIPKAIRLLVEHPDIHNLHVSTFYVSEALGRPEQPNYRNGVARFLTRIDPGTLKRDILRRIEHECGRIRDTDRYAPRTLDLDILLFGDLLINEDDVVVPDSAIWEHVFVTIPLLEIEPSLVVPGKNIALSELAPEFGESTLVRDESLNQLVHEGNYNG